MCLRGGQEHRDLRLTQFTRERDHWKYVESGSKNFHGGVTDLRRENKVVHQYACNDLGKRCDVHILDLYMERLPKEAKDKDAFYFTPLKSFSMDKGKPWFSAVPVGRNTLDCLVKDACKEVGVSGKSNHSLRATGTTRMYQQGVSEKAIQARTGHKSLDALRTYERVSSDQEKGICCVLGNLTNQSCVDSSAVSPVSPVLQEKQQQSVFTISGCTVNIYNAPVTTQGFANQQIVCKVPQNEEEN